MNAIKFTAVRSTTSIFDTPVPRSLHFRALLRGWLHHLLSIEVSMFTDGDTHRYTCPFKEVIYRRFHPDIEILEEWIPTVKKQNNTTVRKQTPEGTTSHQSQTTSCLTGNQCVMCNQSMKTLNKQAKHHNLDLKSLHAEKNEVLNLAVTNYKITQHNAM